MRIQARKIGVSAIMVMEDFKVQSFPSLEAGDLESCLMGQGNS
jgi:hypothetical protein